MRMPPFGIVDLLFFIHLIAEGEGDNGLIGNRVIRATTVESTLR
jgi:hypothetical protein